MAYRTLHEQVRLIIPKLRAELHKGECGRIGVIGGSAEYTGAPYFSAISALKSGADIVHVFCTKMAAAPIKSYHPDLIVHPLLPSRSEVEDQPMASKPEGKKQSGSSPDSAIERISEWLPRLHTLVIGPGLGRDEVTLDCTLGVIAHAKERNLPLIIDADGLFLVSQHPEILKDYPLVTLTPNSNEIHVELFFSVPIILCDRVVQAAPGIRSREAIAAAEARFARLARLARLYLVDILAGDILSGMLAVFTNWALDYYKNNPDGTDLPAMGPQALAAYGACSLVRRCSQLAFNKHGRSMTSFEVVNEIHAGFESLYPED